MSYASRPDLVALCKTSRLLNDLATVLLYRKINIYSLDAVEGFVSTMETYPNRSRHIRALRIAKYDLQFSAAFVTQLNSTISQFCYLESLELLSERAHPELLRDAHFPNLSTLRYHAHPHISAFLNRHPTITCLGLEREIILEPLDPIHLPNLRVYSGPNSFIPSLMLNNKSLEITHILWYPDDLDVETALTALGRIASSGHYLVSKSDNIDEAAFLGSMAITVPDCFLVRFRRVFTLSGRIFTERALEIAQHLNKFTMLTRLEFLNFDDDGHRQVELDLQIVKSWGEACKTLVEVQLHGQCWKRMEKEWSYS
ncbi:hypothetical protein B0H17DRAFT_1201212 [Mycena rosella]|uniref:F-box domain-containing protein n=1 Tax=Mycena rosella TaxID=1033263 RepID=A0AAD7DHC3_MYCRO|nr:hypothetical protein B0H17DRAFT_1201212 [Mycena rosella]